MSKINVMDLPDEILEKIFLDATGSLKSLMGVCKRFNRIVNSSIKLMDKLSVKWNERKLKDIDVLLASQRNYRNIIIKNYKSPRATISRDLSAFLWQRSVFN